MSTDWQQHVYVSNAYDDRVNSKSNTGAHGCDMEFAIVRKNYAISFVVFTQWVLPITRKSWGGNGSHASGAYLIWHSPKRKRGYDLQRFDCSYTCGKCYGSVTYLTDDLFELLVEFGSDALFNALQFLYLESYES